MVIPTAVAQESTFNATRKTTKEIPVHYKLDGGLEFDATINQMEDGFKTNLDTWGPFIENHDGKWVGGMSPEQLVAVNATGVLNNITVAGLHSFTPHDVMGAGMSEGWVRSPIQQVEDSEIGMDVYHVQNPQFANLVPGLGTPAVTSTAANWTSDYNVSGESHWEAGMGEFYECGDNYSAINSDILALWCLDEGSGLSSVDSSGNGYHGTINGATWSDGKLGHGSLTFDGTAPDNDLNFGDVETFVGATEVTGCWWMNYEFTASGRASILAKDNEIEFHASFSNADTYALSINNHQANFNYAPIHNEWTHTCMQWDGSVDNRKLWVNGELKSDITPGHPVAKQGIGLQIGPSGSTDPMCLGWRCGNSYFLFAGTLDEVVMFDTLLTAAEIHNIYTLTAPVNGTFVLAPATNVAGLADWDYHDPNMMGWDDETSTDGGAMGLAPKVWGNKETTDYTQEYNGLGDMIGLWTMNEGGGTDVYDSSVNGNDGTLDGGDWIVGKIGSGLDFDGGVHDEVEIPVDTYDALSTMSAFIWYNTEIDQSYKVMFGNGGIGTGQWHRGGWSIAQRPHADGRFYFDIYTDDGAGTEARDKYQPYDMELDGEWHHVGFTFDNGELILYHDGSAIATHYTVYDTLNDPSDINDEIPANGHNMVRIGDSGRNGNAWDGSLDEAVIYGDVLSATDVASLYSIRQNQTYADGLVGQWLLGEGTGSVAYDTSGNENHGTTTGATYAGGYIGAGMYFDGLGDYVEITGNPEELQITGALTISTWVKSSTGAVQAHIVSRDDLVNRDYFLRDRGADPWRFGVFNSGTEYKVDTTATGLNDNEWHHIVGVFIPDVGLYIYVDGVLDGTENSVPSSIDNDAVNLWIGATNGGNYFGGFMDELMIWDRALSSYEIYNLYLSSYDLHENEYYQSSFGSFAGVEDAYVNPTTVVSLEAIYSDSISETYPGRAYMPDDTNISEYSDLGELTGLWLFDEGHGDYVGDSGPNANGGIITDADYCPGQYEMIGSLSAAYCLNSGTGTAMVDSTGGSSGTMYSSWTTTSHLGSHGLELDGVNDFAQLPSSAGIVSDRTFSAWFKFDTGCSVANSGAYLVAYDSIEAKDIIIWYDAINSHWYFDGQDVAVPGDGSMRFSWTCDTNWHHIVATTGNTAPLVYLDGVNMPDIGGGCCLSGSAGFEIGARSSGTSYQFDGKIDEIMLYDEILSAAEVLELYELTDPGGMWATGQLGSALALDGGGDYVTVCEVDDIGCHPDGGEGSISIWVHTPDGFPTSGTPCFVCYYDTNTDGLQFKFYSNFGQQKIQLFIEHNPHQEFVECNVLSGACTWLAGWNHLVGTWKEGETMELYLNGALVSGLGGLHETTPAGCCIYGDLHLGNENGVYYGQYGSGPITLDDLAIYNNELQSSDVLELYTMSQSRFQSGQMAYWPLDYGGVPGSPYADYDWWGWNPPCLFPCFFDHSDNEHTGVLGDALGSPSTVPVFQEDCRMSNNNCMLFDGANDYLDVADHSDLAPESVTISQWVKRGDGAGSASVVVKYNTYATEIWATEDCGGYFYLGGGWRDVKSNDGSCTDNEWHHVVITFDETTCWSYAYIDGVLKDSKDNSPNCSLNTIPHPTFTDLTIGRWSGSTQVMDGLIDEVMIWSRALDADEVSELYNTTKADCVTYTLTCNPKPQSGHIQRFQVWGSNTNDFNTATLEAEWHEGVDYYMSSEGGRNMLQLSATVPYYRFWWWTTNMSNEYQSTPILHSVMLEMELFTQPYTLVPNPLSDPDLCWSNDYGTPDNDDLHEFHLDGNGVWGRHYLNFKCPIYAGRDINADSLADDAYLFVFDTGGGKVNDTFELWLSQSNRGLDFMKSWAYIYDIDKLWMNDTLPLSLGSDVFFTRGMNHGITGWELEAHKDDPSVVLEFYTKLPEAFSAAEDDELTFHLPVETPNDRYYNLPAWQGVLYSAQVAGYTSDFAQTGVTVSQGSNYLIDDSLLISGMDGVGADGRWDDTTVLDGATILRFRISLTHTDPDTLSYDADEWKYYTHDNNSDFDMGENANFFNKHNQMVCANALSFLGCETFQHIDFTVAHHVSGGTGMWQELTTGLTNNAPVSGPKFLYDAYNPDIYEDALTCLGDTFDSGWCAPSAQLTDYEIEFVNNAQEWENNAQECAEDAGWGDAEFSSASLYSCTKWVTWDSAKFVYQSVVFYGQTQGWGTAAYEDAVAEQFPGQNVGGYVTFKEMYALLNFNDGTMWEAAWLVGAFAEGTITVGVTLLQENMNQISDFVVDLIRYMTFLFIMGTIIGSTSIIHHSIHGRWSVVNYKCATSLTQAAGFLSVVPFVGGALRGVAGSGVSSMNRYRPALRKNTQSYGVQRKPEEKR